MEQLIFIALIVIFSILDSVARKRKRQQERMPQGESSGLPEWDRQGDLETYDAEPSYDEPVEVETVRRGPGPRREPLPRWSPKGRVERTRPTSSEGMIPSDIWEEIAGLARDRLPAPEPAPPPPPPPVEVEPVPVRAHRVHRSHAGYGTDPSSRPRSEQDDLDPLKTRISEDARAVRRQLGSRSSSALRRAVILQEVLGPPAAMRPERFPE